MIADVYIFLSTLSLRRATSPYQARQRAGRDFYPRSPCGERLFAFVMRVNSVYFYPRSPCGERPAPPVYIPGHRLISIHALLAESDLATNIDDCEDPKFLSTLSLRRATRKQSAGRKDTHISIHALLAESDRSRPR